MPLFGRDAIWIRYRMAAPLRILIGISVPVIIIGVATAILKTYQYGFAAYAFVLGTGMVLFLYHYNKGYRLVWDEDHIYMREWGFKNILLQRRPFFSMRYSDIMAMRPGYAGLTTVKSRFMPYEYLDLSSREGCMDILIYPLSLNEGDLIDFFQHLYSKRSDIFPDILADQMRTHGLLS